MLEKLLPASFGTAAILGLGRGLGGDTRRTLWGIRSPLCPPLALTLRPQGKPTAYKITEHTLLTVHLGKLRPRGRWDLLLVNYS